MMKTAQLCTSVRGPLISWFTLLNDLLRMFRARVASLARVEGQVYGEDAYTHSVWTCVFALVP
jgi:hypothetical protein